MLSGPARRLRHRCLTRVAVKLQHVMPRPSERDEMKSLLCSLRIMVWLLPVVCLATALALATSGAATTGHHRPVNALIVGKLSACPAKPTTGYCPPRDHDTVSAFSRGRLVARETVTNAHFSFLVRPGRFRLVARSPGCTCRAARSVTAVANKTARADMQFQLK